MDALIIEKTVHSPEIIFDPENNKFSIEGLSKPENVIAFYEPVIKWIEEYKKLPKKTTTLDIHYVYFNTSSLRSILSMLSKFKEIKDLGYEIIVNWHFHIEDTSMKEAGELLEEISELKFTYYPYEDEDEDELE